MQREDAAWTFVLSGRDCTFSGGGVRQQMTGVGVSVPNGTTPYCRPSVYTVLLGEYNKILHPRLHDVETEPLRFLSGLSRDKEKVDVETFHLKQVM